MRLVISEQSGLAPQRLLSTDSVDRPVAAGAHQPGHRLIRHAIAGPSFSRDDERLLRGFLGEVEIAEEADECGQYPAPLTLEDAVDQWPVSPGMSTSGRTSTAPPSRTAGIRCANSRASSRLSTSITK